MAIKKATLASRWMSVSDISARLTQARDNRERQRKLLDTLEGQAARRRDEIERSLADLPSSHRTQLVNRALGGFRGELKRASADERLKLVREIGRLREE